MGEFVVEPRQGGASQTALAEGREALVGMLGELTKFPTVTLPEGLTFPTPTSTSTSTAPIFQPHQIPSTSNWEWELPTCNYLSQLPPCAPSTPLNQIPTTIFPDPIFPDPPAPYLQAPEVLALVLEAREHLNAASLKLARLESLFTSTPNRNVDHTPPTCIADNSCGDLPSSLKRELLTSNDSGKIARRLATYFFEDAERIPTNVMGRRGREGLDPIRIAKLKNLFFSVWKVEPQYEKAEWSRAVRKIDEATRSLRRNAKLMSED